MRRMLLGSCLFLSACAGPVPGPVAIRLGEETCAFCRMTIVSTSTAAQIDAPGGEPVMFDEIGCLQRYLADTAIPGDAVVFVTDHRTGAWVKAKDAVFTRTALQTPMASGLLAHADAASRDLDAAAAGGSFVAPASVIAPPGRSETR